MPFRSSRADEADDADEVDFYEVAKEKQLLDDERRIYTEAAVRLGQERRQLEVSDPSISPRIC